MTPYTLARYAQLAYFESTVKVKNIEVLISDPGGGLLIIPRGTERSYRDILTDLRGIPQKDDDLGWCHSGFIEAARAVWPKIKLELSHVHDYPIWCGGHSLGGALATILAALMVVDGMEVAGLATFGSPRVGFVHLGDILGGVPILRFVRGRDAVPTHPWPLWGYRHVSDAIAIGKPQHRWEDHQMQGYVDDLTPHGSS